MTSVELPEFNKCCFCCPLRPGLIAWGYIKLVLTIALAIIWMIILSELCIFIPFCVDSVFIIIFIVSAHRNDHKLMKVFYYYSFVIVFLSGAAVILYTIWLLTILSDTSKFELLDLFLIIILPTILMIAVNAMVQIYITVLIRNEILNLKYNLQCKFVKKIVQDDSETGSARQEKVAYGRLVVTDVVSQETEKNMIDKFWALRNTTEWP